MFDLMSLRTQISDNLHAAGNSTSNSIFTLACTDTSDFYLWTATIRYTDANNRPAMPDGHGDTPETAFRDLLIRSIDMTMLTQEHTSMNETPTQPNACFNLEGCLSSVNTNNSIGGQKHTFI